MKRRDFLITSGACCATAAVALSRPRTARAEQEAGTRAMHWEARANEHVQCILCPRRCELAHAERGYCGVRRNDHGVLYTLVHSRPCSVHTDPIEKKPLFHYRPGTDAFSLATAGCNLECQFCQNWRISQFRPEEVQSISLPPDRVLAEARSSGARSLAWTYSEPTVFYEYVYDSSQLARAQGLGSVIISNGFMNPGPMGQLLGVLDAVKIDLKSFRDSFYREVCDGELQPVLETLRLVRSRGVWLEIVVLVIPTRNDSDAEVRAMARWIVQELGPDVPLHFTRFSPTYRLENLPPTPVRTIERLRQISLEAGVHYVYLGNVPGHEGENTYCASCHRELISRDGFYVTNNVIRDGRCPQCHAAIPGVWS
jgi:pyruvate formate lyase activating enzyme